MLGMRDWDSLYLLTTKNARVDENATLLTTVLMLRKNARYMEDRPNGPAREENASY
jgi:hypothetical protein